MLQDAWCGSGGVEGDYFGGGFGGFRSCNCDGIAGALNDSVLGM